MTGAVRLALAALALAPLAAVTARRLNDAGEDGRDIEAPAGALVLLLAGLVVIEKFSVWVEQAANAIDGPGIIGLAILIGAFLVVVCLPVFATFLYGLMSGASLFGSMLLPTQPAKNKHGPNPHEVIK